MSSVSVRIELDLFNHIDYAVAVEDMEISKEYCKKYSIDGTKTILENIISERSDIDHWLVYFSKIKDLKKNIDSLKKLLPNYKVFTMYSQNEKMNDEQLKEFNGYKGKSMLLTVSMVLEGIHPKNVGGILLYRNITRNNTLLQVLGRVCNINKKIKPICIDIPDSIHNIPRTKISELVVHEQKSTNSVKSKKSIRNIIDVKASSYKYVELLSNIMGDLYVNEYRGFRWSTNKELSLLLGKHETYVNDIRHNHNYTYEQIIDIYLNGKPKKYSYRGLEWDYNTELDALLGKYKGYVRNALNKYNYTYEQIIDINLDGKPLKPKKYSYRGFEWDSDRELSKLLGKSKGTVNYAINNGYTYKQIIDMHLDGKSNKYSYRGFEWDSDNMLCILLGRDNYYVGRKRIDNYTYEQIIDEVLDGKPKKYSYRGLEWDSDTELRELTGIGYAFMKSRHKEGYTNEQIIDMHLDGKPKKYSYRGLEWDSNTELSRLLGKDKNYVTNVISTYNYTYEQIIDINLDGKPLKSKKYSYRGLEWDSNTELDALLGKYKGYVTSIKNRNNYTYEQIIDINLDGKPLKSKKYSYRGLEWDSNTELSRLLGKQREYVRLTCKKGYTYEQIIDEHLDGKPKKFSYRGFEWDSNRELCKLLGKHKDYIRNMYERNNYTYKQIIDVYLDGKPKKYSYRGLEWDYETELAKLLGRSRDYIRDMRKKGYTYEQIIDINLDKKDEGDDKND